MAFYPYPRPEELGTRTCRAERSLQRLTVQATEKIVAYHFDKA